jgi:hypothetical protein
MPPLIANILPFVTRNIDVMPAAAFVTMMAVPAKVYWFPLGAAKDPDWGIFKPAGTGAPD